MKEIKMKCKKCKKMLKVKTPPKGLKVVKPVVKAGVTLGVGATALGAMGQGAVAGQIVTPAAKGLGVVATVGMGMGVLDAVSDMTKKKKRK